MQIAKAHWQERTFREASSRATLYCTFPRGRLEASLQSSRGPLRHKREMYMADAFPAEMFPAEPTELFWVNGIDVTDTFWLETP